MAWKLHPPVQSVLHPAEQTTEYQIKFIRQGNRLLSYLIGSWGLRTGFSKKEWWSVYFRLLPFCYTCLCFYLLSVFAWEMFQCSDSLNESNMWVCWGSLCVVLSSSLSLANTIGHVAGFSLANKTHYQPLVSNNEEPFTSLQQKKPVSASRRGDTIHNLCLFSPILSQRFQLCSFAKNLQCLLLAFKSYISRTLLVGLRESVDKITSITTLSPVEYTQLNKNIK